MKALFFSHLKIHYFFLPYSLDRQVNLNSTDISYHIVSSHRDSLTTKFAVKNLSKEGIPVFFS